MKIILLGPPGSGKGTISELLVKELGFYHVSPGELLREEVSKKTTIGEEIQKYMEKGDLVPDQFVVELVKLAIDGKDNFLLDGFPRTLEQAKTITELGVEKVIYLEVPEDVILKRFSGRRVCEKEGHTFNLNTLPPKNPGVCDYDGSNLIQRKDDNPDVIKERFRIFHEKTKPLMAFYSKKGLLTKVNGNQSPEAVFMDVKKVLK